MLCQMFCFPESVFYFTKTMGSQTYRNLTEIYSRSPTTEFSSTLQFLFFKLHRLHLPEVGVAGVFSYCIQQVPSACPVFCLMTFVVHVSLSVRHSYKNYQNLSLKSYRLLTSLKYKAENELLTCTSSSDLFIPYYLYMQLYTTLSEGPPVYRKVQ